MTVLRNDVKLNELYDNIKIRLNVFSKLIEILKIGWMINMLVFKLIIIIFKIVAVEKQHDIVLRL